MKWIELHTSLEKSVLINAEHITDVHTYEKEGCSVYVTSSDTPVHVIESYEEIKKYLYNLY